MRGGDIYSISKKLYEYNSLTNQSFYYIRMVSILLYNQPTKLKLTKDSNNENMVEDISSFPDGFIGFDYLNSYYNTSIKDISKVYYRPKYRSIKDRIRK